MNLIGLIIAALQLLVAVATLAHDVSKDRKRKTGKHKR